MRYPSSELVLRGSRKADSIVSRFDGFEDDNLMRILDRHCGQYRSVCHANAYRNGRSRRGRDSTHGHGSPNNILRWKGISGRKRASSLWIQVWTFSDPHRNLELTSDAEHSAKHSRKLSIRWGHYTRRH